MPFRGRDKGVRTSRPSDKVMANENVKTPSIPVKRGGKGYQGRGIIAQPAPFVNNLTELFNRFWAWQVSAGNAPPYVATRGGKGYAPTYPSGGVRGLHSRFRPQLQEPQRAMKPPRSRQSNETYGVAPYNPGQYPEGGGGGGGYEPYYPTPYTPTPYAPYPNYWNRYQQGYATENAPAQGAVNMRAVTQAQPYRGYADQNQAQRWIQYLINWRTG